MDDDAKQRGLLGVVRLAEERRRRRWRSFSRGPNIRGSSGDVPAPTLTGIAESDAAIQASLQGGYWQGSFIQPEIVGDDRCVMLSGEQGEIVGPLTMSLAEEWMDHFDNLLPV